MQISRKLLCWLYGVIALLALIATWGNNLAYVKLGFVGATLTFWTETLANPASRSITADIFFLGLGVFVWMVLEARRLAMRGVWLYLLFGMLIAISVTVPVFLIQRERALARHAPGSAGGRLLAGDLAGLALTGACVIGYAALTFWHTSPKGEAAPR